MPPWRNWWHLILTTRGAWLPGDPRGFRSRDHRIHSSGDYKNRPPDGEHKKLHGYNKTKAKRPVVFTVEVRELIGKSLLTKLEKEEIETLIVAIDPMHAHLLVRHTRYFNDATKLSGRLKQAASHAIRNEIPGRIWASGGKPIPINDRAHQLRVFNYIQDHANEGAWVWHFKMQTS